ncbi:hypothetical protein BDK51DRAFT_38768 [Blyttiomyces helicus]|uniref:Uncharacterized protein n=1 Tax=Blyttiomyces helicus TaxID=388810 RepID=A0A4P9W822_9FUNG|nr:hypothetical protein BDK51DRAFT_38768 [Blyttiomyces helicus]|eukprot:RKO87565.1 hypothetical protein BDK51DRAFT_38768 [Blyttiomyces helicus]
MFTCPSLSELERRFAMESRKIARIPESQARKGIRPILMKQYLNHALLPRTSTLRSGGLDAIWFSTLVLILSLSFTIILVFKAAISLEPVREEWSKKKGSKKEASKASVKADDAGSRAAIGVTIAATSKKDMEEQAVQMESPGSPLPPYLTPELGVPPYIPNEPSTTDPEAGLPVGDEENLNDLEEQDISDVPIEYERAIDDAEMDAMYGYKDIEAPLPEIGEFEPPTDAEHTAGYMSTGRTHRGQNPVRDEAPQHEMGEFEDAEYSAGYMSVGATQWGQNPLYGEGGDGEFEAPSYDMGNEYTAGHMSAGGTQRGQGEVYAEEHLQGDGDLEVPSYEANNEPAMGEEYAAGYDMSAAGTHRGQNPFFGGDYQTDNESGYTLLDADDVQNEAGSVYMGEQATFEATAGCQRSHSPIELEEGGGYMYPPADPEQVYESTASQRNHNPMDLEVGEEYAPSDAEQYSGPADDSELVEQHEQGFEQQSVTDVANVDDVDGEVVHTAEE